MNIAKLPSVPRQMLKDIPRPPNTPNQTYSTAVTSVIGTGVMPSKCPLLAPALGLISASVVRRTRKSFCWPTW